MISLSNMVLKHLKAMPLTLSQQADIATSKGGDFIPENMEVALLDIQILFLEGNVTELIKLYKRLPRAQALNSSLAEYLKLPPSPDLSKARLADSVTLENTPLASREWRMNNLYLIINKRHVKTTFRRNLAQRYLAEKLLEHPRVIVLKSRQRGISTDAVLTALDSCMTNPNRIRGLQADSLDAANALMEKAKLAYRALPESLKPELIYSNNSVLEFSNGSKIRISTSFRGATLSALHVSELGKISLNHEKASELKSGTLPALPLNPETEVVLESTSEGAGNMFYDMYQEAVESYKPGNLGTYCPIFIGWVGIVEAGNGGINHLIYQDSRDQSFGRASEIPEEYRVSTADADCWLFDEDMPVPRPLNDMLIKLQKELDYTFSPEQIEWATATYKSLGNDIAEFMREYPATAEQSFASSGEGLILAESFRAATVDTSIDWNPKYPRYAASDLGVSDTCSTLFFQYIEGRVKIVDEIHETGKPIAYYVENIKAEKVDVWFLPHDANNRNIATANKVVTHVRLAGFSNYRVLKQSKDIWTDISRVRMMMPNIEFGDVPELIEAVKGYRKVWSTQTGGYLDKPLHDVYSNPCDALRYTIDAVIDIL